MSSIVNWDEFMASVPEAKNGNGRYVEGTLTDLFTKTGQGERDKKLCKLAGYYRDHRLDFDTAFLNCDMWDQRYCDPPLGTEYVRRKIEYWWSHWPEGTKAPTGEETAPSEWEILRIEELFAKEAEYGQLQWMVENGFALGRVHVISAPPKSVKTWVGMSLAQALTSGGLWLGRFPVPVGGCLWIDEEMGHQLTIIRLKKLGFEPTVPFYYMGRQRFRLDVAEDVAKVIEFIKENGISLVVIDSLRRVHRKKENDNSEMGQLMQPMQAIAEAGAALIVIHHDRKKGTDSDVEHEQSAGAGDLIAQMDMVFGIKKIANNSHRLTCRAPRLCSNETALGVDFTLEDGPDGSVTLREIDAMERAMEEDAEQEEAVRDALAEGPSDCRNLDRKLGWRNGQASRVCKRLAEAGMLSFQKGPHNSNLYSLPG